MQKCKVCEFWVEWVYKTEVYLKKFPSNKDKGDCHIRAPVVAGTSEDGFGCWPDTNKDDWCGEFFPRKPLTKEQ